MYIILYTCMHIYVYTYIYTFIYTYKYMYRRHDGLRVLLTMIISTGHAYECVIFMSHGTHTKKRQHIT